MDLDDYGSSSHPSWWHLRGLDMFWHIPSPVGVQLEITPSNKMPRNPWFQPPKRLDEEIYFDQWCYHGPTACGLTLKGQMCLQDFHGASIFLRIWICLKMGAPKSIKIHWNIFQTWVTWCSSPVDSSWFHSLPPSSSGSALPQAVPPNPPWDLPVAGPGSEGDLRSQIGLVAAVLIKKYEYRKLFPTCQVRVSRFYPLVN